MSKWINGKNELIEKGEWKMKERLKGILIGSALTTMLMGSVAYAANGTQIEVYFKNLKYMIDGTQKVPTEGQGFIYEGTTYVPLRFIGEALGKEVNWDGSTETIWVGKKDGEFKYLTSIEYARIDGDTSWVYFDKIGDQKFKIASNPYQKGLGAKTGTYKSEKKTSISYNLNGKYTKLSGFLGIDDSTKNSAATGNVRFIGDGKELKGFNNLKGGNNPIAAEIDVTNVLKLEIVFENEGTWPGNEYLNFILADAKLQ
ncbi:NPCBM/NEW2 domain-containing protein [Paenibacillus tyrfis]|uniref:NPCBM/NEW2 domain-containing protein n=1 Tax=Paenibacillus tyrfis TaxID=1501230 RepID=UPI00069071E4|nr:NPCBM/NEW2 domain-containing protein [Paenibacillus tyrfis]